MLASSSVTNLVRALALDVAGLGLLGAGTYSLITGKGGAGAPTTLLSLGAAYLGVKVSAVATATKTATPASSGTAVTP